MGGNVLAYFGQLRQKFPTIFRAGYQDSEIFRQSVKIFWYKTFRKSSESVKFPTDLYRGGL